jgi:hypothetical protein
MANDSDFDTDLPPPLIPDSDTDGYDTEDIDFTLRIIRPDVYTSLAVAQPVATTPTLPPICIPTLPSLYQVW